MLKSICRSFCLKFQKTERQQRYTSPFNCQFELSNIQSIFKIRTMSDTVAPQQKTHYFSDSPSESEQMSLGKASGQNIKDGHWNQTQLFRFIAFLVYNRQTLKLKLQRRTSKVFKQMSDFIGTRTSVQCRSQNQRLFRKFKNFRNIVSTFKADYGREKFDRDYRSICETPGIKFKTELENLLGNQVKMTAEKSIQTDEPIVPQTMRRPSLQFENPFSWSNPWNYTPNVMIVPYFS